MMALLDCISVNLLCVLKYIYVFIQCSSPTDPVKNSSNTTMRLLRKIAKFVIENLDSTLASRFMASALRTVVLVSVLQFCPRLRPWSLATAPIDTAIRIS